MRRSRSIYAGTVALVLVVVVMVHWQDDNNSDTEADPTHSFEAVNEQLRQLQEAAKTLLALQENKKMEERGIMTENEMTQASILRGLASVAPSQKPEFSLDNGTVSNIKTKLVILTYMRSGSSFTGDIFQHNPETFYVYEPLWTLQKIIEGGKKIKYLDGSEVTPSMSPLSAYNSSTGRSGGSGGEKKLEVDILTSMLGCRFDHVDIDTLMQGHMLSSKDTVDFKYCLNKNHTLKKLQYCAVRDLIQPCKKQQVSVLKVIRLGMDQAAKMMTSDPNVKVIHLIRDPRGMFYSQWRVMDLKWDDLENQARLRCDRIMNDIQQSIQLNKLFPNRVLTVRYEDIAVNPIQSAEQMYKFAGLDMTDSIRGYLHNITNGKVDGCSICTTRKNATVTAYKWRTKMKFESVRTIDNNCMKVYNVMGFRPYLTKEEVASELPKLDRFSDTLYRTQDVS